VGLCCLIIPKLCLDLPSGLFPSGIHTRYLNIHLLTTMRVTNQVYTILRDLITIIVFGEDQTLLNNRHQFPLISSIFDSSIFPSILFSSTLTMCSFLNVKDQVSHPYKTISKFMQGDQKVSVYLIVTVQKHAKMF
jgi:hypothetical protein